MIRILHAADLHLDSPFESLPEDKTAVRRREQRQLLRSLAQLRAERGAQLVLMAGDIFDRDVAFAETEEALCAAIAEMAVPVVISPGNHDYYAKGGRWDRLRLPPNAHIFTRSAMECLELPSLGARVYGAAFTDRYCEPLLRTFHAPREEGVLNIMCVHGEVGVQASRYNAIYEADIGESGMDYVALGHVHAFSGGRRAGHVPYAWPGCPEGRGYDECGVKGVILADVGEHEAKIEFVPTCLRRYETLSFDLGSGAAVELPPDAERNCYKIILTGETEEAPDLAALRRALEGRCFGLRLKDETHLRRDVWARAGEDTLRGTFLRMLRERYEAAEDAAARERIDRAARWGLAALDRREEAEEL